MATVRPVPSGVRRAALPACRGATEEAAAARRSWRRRRGASPRRRAPAALQLGRGDSHVGRQRRRPWAGQELGQWAGQVMLGNCTVTPKQWSREKKTVSSTAPLPPGGRVGQANPDSSLQPILPEQAQNEEFRTVLTIHMAQKKESVAQTTKLLVLSDVQKHLCGVRWHAPSKKRTLSQCLPLFSFKKEILLLFIWWTLFISQCQIFESCFTNLLVSMTSCRQGPEINVTRKYVCYKLFTPVCSLQKYSL